MSEDLDEDLLAVAGALLNVLAQRGWGLGTAESLTGGWSEQLSLPFRERRYHIWVA
jgi:nicotinamide mononucleotide (NMN) deamidase PncC